MATKVIVRYLPLSPIHGERTISPKDLEGIGIFTQKKMLVWRQDTGWWLDATDEANVSKETLAWLRANTAEFTVEEQEVDGDADPQAEAFSAAYQASLTTSERVEPDNVQVEGQNKSESTSTRGASTTTQSTAS